MKILNTSFLALFCIILSCLELRAQEIVSKSFSLSGTANLKFIDGSEIDNYREQANYSAAIQANYFLWDNISLNVGYRYGNENQVALMPIYTDSYKNEYHGAYIQLRKYWFFNKYLGMYVGAEYGNRWETKTQNMKVDLANKAHHQYIGLIPGIFVFPFERLGVEMSYGSLAYQRSVTKDHTGKIYDRRSSFNFTYRPNLNLGIHYFILRK